MTRLRAAVLAFAVAAACGGPQEPGAFGDECFRDDDCEPGLVCVGVESASERVCTNDVTGLVSTVPGPTAPAEGGAPAAGGAPAGGAPDQGGAAPADGGAPPLGGSAGTGGSGGTGGTGGSGGTAGSGGTSTLAGAGGA